MLKTGSHLQVVTGDTCRSEVQKLSVRKDVYKELELEENLQKCLRTSLNMQNIVIID